LAGFRWELLVRIRGLVVLCDLLAGFRFELLAEGQVSGLDLLREGQLAERTSEIPSAGRLCHNVRAATRRHGGMIGIFDVAIISVQDIIHEHREYFFTPLVVAG
jgi:hypothetical protein